MTTFTFDNWLTEDSLTTNPELLETLESAIFALQDLLIIFADDLEFEQKMTGIFEADESQATLGSHSTESPYQSYRNAWLSNDFSIFSYLEIRTRNELNGANGAYSVDTNKIYLAQEFLAENQDNVETIADVLLEEAGHRIDAEVNPVERIGDEGAIFAKLVQGETITSSELQALQGEDDTANIVLDGQNITIEQANVSWVGGSGDWYEGSNWSTGSVPTANDNITITADGVNLTITFSQGNSNVSFSLYAKNGAVLDVSSLTSYTGRGSFDTTFKAEGSDSKLNLSGITNLTGGGSIYHHNIDAVSGGEIDLTGLTSIDGGATEILADGAGSEVNLSGLTSFTDNAFDASWLQTINDGKIFNHQLTDLNAVTIYLRGNTNIDTAQITNFNNGNIVVEGVNPDFSGLTNIDGISLNVSNGGSLDLSHITSYTGRGSFDTTFKAEGSDSKLNLSGITNLTGGGSIYHHNIDAVSGGEIDLTGLTSIDGGATEILADGAGSEVNLSGLTSFTDNAFDASWLQTINDGTILANYLNQLENVDNITIQSGGLLDASNTTTLNSNGTLVSIDGAGSIFDLSNVIQYSGLTFNITNDGILLIDSGTNPPSDIQLSNTTIAENSPSGTVIGTLTTTDQDSNDTHNYTLLDNAINRFAIEDDKLIVNDGDRLDYEKATSHEIVIRTTDSDGAIFEKNFVINLTNIVEIGAVEFAQTVYSIDENAGNASILIRRINGDEGSLTATINLTNGSAIAGQDYTNNSPITVNFGDGITSQTINIPRNCCCDRWFIRLWLLEYSQFARFFKK